MCRNIKVLANFEPPASDGEIQASALQFVRKLSGFNLPSKANEVAGALPGRERSRPGRRIVAVLFDPAFARTACTSASEYWSRCRRCP